ncbi:DUF5701 family protein [Streptomyces sp. KR80]|uniref:DUF5701 family protein n=1 Tax=Streptomyces sp. KR80 TaxID=3457426 RepID=UPI003FD1BA2A
MPAHSQPQQQPRTTFDAVAEFDRQVQNLLDRDYAALADLSPDSFARSLSPLRDVAVAHSASAQPPEAGHAPFLLVITRALVPIERTMPLTTLHGKTKPGFVDRSFEPGALERFVPAEPVQLPDERAYLLFDVDRGEEFCGAVPREAMAAIAERQRTVLTIEEGIAFVTHCPAALAKNKCFSLGGSRCGDRRVPAIWISQNAPKLGWCWEGNPHTWLGMASAGSRGAA